MKTVGARIKLARIEKGLSQAQLAIKSGVGQSTIGSLEAERNHSTTKLVDIARALGVSTDWLATGRGPKEVTVKFEAGENYYVAARTPEELAEQLLAKGNDHVAQLLNLVLQMKDQKRQPG